MFKTSRIFWPAIYLAVFCPGQTSAKYPALTVLLTTTVLIYLQKYDYLAISADLYFLILIPRIVQMLCCHERYICPVNKNSLKKIKQEAFGERRHLHVCDL